MDGERFHRQVVKCIDCPVKHAFTFTPSFSLFVECESEQEIQRLATALGEGGAVLMPLLSRGCHQRTPPLSAAGFLLRLG